MQIAPVSEMLLASDNRKANTSFINNNIGGLLKVSRDGGDQDCISSSMSRTQTLFVVGPCPKPCILWLFTWQGKRDFADAIKVKDLDMGRLFWII